MVKFNVWMSTEFKPLYTVEYNDKYNIYEVVKWQRAGKVYEGERVDRFYDLEDAHVFMTDLWADLFWELQHAEVA